MVISNQKAGLGHRSIFSPALVTRPFCPLEQFIVLKCTNAIPSGICNAGTRGLYSWFLFRDTNTAFCLALVQFDHTIPALTTSFEPKQTTSTPNCASSFQSPRLVSRTPPGEKLPLAFPCITHSISGAPPRRGGGRPRGRSAHRGSSPRRPPSRCQSRGGSS